MEWLIAKIGAKAAKAVSVAGIIFLALLIAFLFGKCSDRSPDIAKNRSSSPTPTRKRLVTQPKTLRIGSVTGPRPNRRSTMRSNK